MAVCFTDVQERDLAYREDLLRRVLAEIDDGQYSEADLRAAFAAGRPAAGSSTALVRGFEDTIQVFRPEIAEPVLRGVADTLGHNPDRLMRWHLDPLDVGADRTVTRNRDAALLPSSHFTPAGQPAARKAQLNAGEQQFLAVVGILEREKALDRPGGLRFSQALRLAQGEHDELEEVYQRALPRLVREGEAGPVDRARAVDWAGIVETLRKDRVGADALYFDLHVTNALDGRTGAGPTTTHYGAAGAKPSWIDISLPDLENEADLDIVEDNLMAMQAIFFASTLEEVRFFQVMDKILELFNIGVLPFGKGPAGDKVFAYWKRGFDRFTEVERQNLYARALGKPGGDVGAGTPNRQFQDLWIRFISSVSEWRRQVAVDRLLRDDVPFAVSDQQLRKSARDLGSNMSLYGYGIAYFVATELQQQIRDIVDILSDEEVRAAYGARDLWQVIDQVATLELGGARNSVRYRTMANSGAVIIRWLAKHSRQLSRVGFDQLLVPSDLVPTARNGKSPLVDPTNFDVIEACEQYLAVTGTPDERVEHFAQPVLGPDGTSRPVQIPGFARDVFESVGVNPADIGQN